ncbi:hypothetical protein Sjap_001044 [Stephania japonica]|uniref:non-specific serine/threonine protein kinase n=1 Tax=Stephania japonica TaxID=461633 RepID=A0AAP0PT46_9MAGN
MISCSPSSMSLSVLLSLVLLLVVSTSATTNFKNETDQISLLAFKKGIVDPSGILNSWNDSLDLCQWKGVACGRRHQRVTALTLRGSGLNGYISPFIGNLTFLRSIDLANNSLYGRIPQEIGRLFRLEHLFLHNNSLGGDIPSNLSQCFRLRELDISKNHLEGKIPEELTTLSMLTDLELFSNNLTGGIPHSIGNVSSLQEMSLAYNNLEGSIPHTIAQLKSLTLLQIAANRFSGVVPAVIYNMSSLNFISVTANQLQGEIPQDIGLALPNLKHLYLAGNQFSGVIPESLSNISQLQHLDLSGNSFIGKIPSRIGDLRSLQELNLELNQLGSGTEGDLSFIASLINCKSLEVLALDGNHIGGVLPASISNLSTELSQFLLGRNQIYGNIPASIGNFTKLSYLALERNVLTGSIPSSLGKLQNLEGLLLHGNRLTGKIPHSIGNISLLNRLILADNQLEGSIPTSLGQCKRLQTLFLAKNNLGGIIPNGVLTELSSLSFISIRINSFYGPIPLEVGNLKNLVQFSASQNNLNGEIPITLGSCASLESLYLDENFLVGEIPQTLNALKGLSDLDLSKNNLSGPIPKYLETFPLEYLNLSFNNLEGEVPTGGVFGNSSRVFVDQNAELCGGIVQLHLPRCTVKQSNNRGKSSSHHKKIILIVVPVSVVGFLLVFFSILLCCRMRTKKKLSATSSMDKFNMIKLSYQDLFKATNGFSATNLIGSGSFGSVYKGLLSQDEKIVAVKVLNLQQRGATKTFKAECNALRNIRHRNLLEILTSCSSIDSKGNDFKALVSEFMPNGSLDEWLHPRHNDEESQPRKLSLIQRINILVDVAYALDYLHHDCHMMIVHCDLKPSNILLDADMIAHVGDFGLARLFSQAHQNLASTPSSSIGIKGSVGYAAPEYGIGGEASKQGDAYSFGILLLEVMTGRRPTDEMFRDGLYLHIFAKMAIPERVMQIVDPELVILEEIIIAKEADSRRNEIHSGWADKIEECTIRLIKIGVECSVEAPRERMDMKDVTKELHLIRNTLLDIGTIGAVSTRD